VRNGNLLWKAVQYTKLESLYFNIPLLKTGDSEVKEDEDKASLFINIVFLQPAPHEALYEGHPLLQIL
jgi:hypothetical protein